MNWSHAKGQMTQKREVRRKSWDKDHRLKMEDGHLNQAEPFGMTYNFRLSEADKKATDWEVYDA